MSEYSIGDVERAAHIDEIHRLRAQLEIANAVHELAAANYQRRIDHLRAVAARHSRIRKAGK
ncbi:hypothetical protein [Nocardia cyriacigeorgica]|uniref:hypothetical protein n=1 Tax=Nocardia cyriacigeorgica TaxID=135487 RepID=UPI0013D2CC5A|nr:hypothetical protein [Nocardia cyriacigeorgica]NEW27279.1 hypothetical protein [Nocardia cyriacigeorgica]